MYISCTLHKLDKYIFILKLNSGCINFEILREHLELEYHSLDNGYLYIKTIVKEEGTEYTEEITEQIKITDSAFSLEIVARENIFQTGLPYNAAVKLKNAQIPINNETVQICLALKMFYYRSLQTVCSNFTSNTVGSVPFTIPPLVEEVSRIDISVSSIGYHLFTKYVNIIF